MSVLEIVGWALVHFVWQGAGIMVVLPAGVDGTRASATIAEDGLQRLRTKRLARTTPIASSHSGTRCQRASQRA